VPIIVTNTQYVVYDDLGIPPGTAVYDWAAYTGPVTFNGNSTGNNPPEGIYCFLSQASPASNWAGWGVFASPSTTNMSQYASGYLKFWVNSSTNLNIQVEGPSGTKGTYVTPSTTNAWQQFSVPISTFVSNNPSLNLTQTYGLFEVTAPEGTTFYIDYVRWSPSP
jgi:hypothetical protein